ncbi:acetyltransferase [Apiospora sp. TS-2023a]
MAHVVPRELDLNHCGHDSIVDKFNAVPGLRTSTAFFTFLRANLVVNPSAMSSNANTPMLEPYSSQTLPPPSPVPLAAIADDHVAAAPSPGHQGLGPVPDDLPPLEIGILKDETDQVDALNLVADSIAQQRQLASFYAVFHPYLLAVLAAALGLAFQFSWRARRDLGMALMLHSAVLMTYLLAIRYFTGRYIAVAEDLRWDWLLAPDTGEQDTVLGVRYGKTLIGALVLRLEPPAAVAAAGAKRRTRASALRGGKGVIRAWTVMLRYRGNGVGSDLLHEAVKVTREKCGKEAAVGFAKEHANSTMVLPEVFNGQFRKNEQRAAKALDKVLGEGIRRKR